MRKNLNVSAVGTFNPHTASTKQSSSSSSGSGGFTSPRSLSGSRRTACVSSASRTVAAPASQHRCSRPRPPQCHLRTREHQPSATGSAAEGKSSIDRRTRHHRRRVIRLRCSSRSLSWLARRNLSRSRRAPVDNITQRLRIQTTHSATITPHIGNAEHNAYRQLHVPMNR